MAAINWDSTSLRTYEAGLDKVVLYTYGNPGVPWFSFRSFEESISGGDARPYFIDGYKYLNLAAAEEFGASFKSIGYPPEFEACDGIQVLAAGLYVTQQKRKPFSLCFRTLLGSDTVPLGTNYKIHLVYNALAEPSNRSHVTLQNDPSMETLQWTITSKPIKFPGIKPLSHLIIDSRTANPVYLKTLENYLYGSVTNEPLLPDPGQVAAILSGETVSFEE